MTDRQTGYTMFWPRQAGKKAFMEAIRLENHKGCEIGKHFYPKEPGFTQECPKCKEWF